MKDGTLKGILWHQGEGDSGTDATAAYKEKLKDLVAALRKEFGGMTVPFVAGELGHFRKHREMFNRVLHESIREIPHFGVVTVEGLQSIGDSTHFDAVSQRELGRRYALKLKTINE
jgi:hypothetical protein